ncbi:MAG: FAD-dependent thymidylate synthase [bacterium]
MIKLLETFYMPITHIGKVAGICYNADTENDTKNYERGLDCINSGHDRVLEYVDITLEISEYSARCIRELYTSIIGVSRLQESTRYVNCEDFNYYIPESIKKNEIALIIYNSNMRSIKSNYSSLITLGIPKEDVANILPLGMNTKIVLKINLRALIHMFEIRTCARAYMEYRMLMGDLFWELCQIDPEWQYLCENVLLTKCDKVGYCTEKNSCGRWGKKDDR